MTEEVHVAENTDAKQTEIELARQELAAKVLTGLEQHWRDGLHNGSSLRRDILTGQTGAEELLQPCPILVGAVYTDERALPPDRLKLGQTGSRDRSEEIYTFGLGTPTQEIATKLLGGEQGWKTAVAEAVQKREQFVRDGGKSFYLPEVVVPLGAGLTARLQIGDYSKGGAPDWTVDFTYVSMPVENPPGVDTPTAIQVVNRILTQFRADAKQSE